MNKVILMGRLCADPDFRQSRRCGIRKGESLLRWQGILLQSIADSNARMSWRRISSLALPSARRESLRRNISKKGRWFLLSGGCRCVAGMTTKAKSTGPRRLSLRSSISLKESMTVKKTAEASLRRNRTVPQRHRASLRRRPGNKWGWRIALGFIPSTKV